MQVALFKERSSVELLQKRLQQAGIAASIHQELTFELFWFVSKKSSGVRLEVPAADFERAYNLLCQWDQAEGVLQQAVRCPQCGSFRVEYPQVTRKSILTNFAMGLLAQLGLMEKDYFCEECHYMWPKEGARPPRMPAHPAPDYFLERGDQPRPGAP